MLELLRDPARERDRRQAWTQTLMLELRPYQQRAIAELRATYAAGYRAPCLVLPTGAGKTVVGASIIDGAVARGNRALFLAHRTELIDQTARKLAAAGIHDVRIIQAERDLGHPLAPVIVASVQTVTTDRWIGRLPQPNLIIVDECHHLVAESWTRVVRSYPSAMLLGLTATPQRGDGHPLGDMFDSIVVGATVAELTDLGHLVPCRVWAPPSALETAELALDPVAAYQQHGGGQRAILFAVTVEQARRSAADFAAAGIASDVVTGNGSRRARADSLERFAAGATRVLCNVNVLTEGFDDPPVAVCILARKPQHSGLFLQMAGRVLRPAPGKASATLIDLCGSVHDHGTPDMPREYSLDGRAISKAPRDAIRQCPTCGAVFLAAAVCPTCGAELPRRPMALPRSTGVGVVDVTALKRPPRPAPMKQIPAKYQGWCRECRDEIRVGEPIWWAKGGPARHVTCRSREVA